MPDILTITEDDRPIKSIVETRGGGVFWQVGVGDVTEIVAYEEHGWGSMVPWFAVYDPFELRVRVPAQTVVVEYATSTGGENETGT